MTFYAEHKKSSRTCAVRTSYPCITTQQRSRDAEAKKRPVRLRDLAARRGLVPKGAFLSCAFRTQWINDLFFGLLIAICKTFGTFNQICHNLIELHGIL